MRERMHKLRRISTYVTDQKALEALKAMVAEINRLRGPAPGGLG